MDYLLTWIEGEEVGYQLIQREELNKICFEDNKNYTLYEIAKGQLVDLSSLLEQFEGKTCKV